MKIVFYCDSIPFSLGSLEKHPLGGTESSVISLSKELAKLGHDIRIIGETDQYHILGNVEFIPLYSFSPAMLACDVFVSVRDANAIASLDLSKAKKVIFWSHDVTQHPSSEHLLNNTQGIVDKIDTIVVISDFVKAQFDREDQPHLRNKMRIIRNGYDADFLVPPEKSQTEVHCSYHSMPYRGLVYLLDMWPTISEAVPNAHLHLFTGNQIYGGLDNDNQWLYNRATRFKNIEVHGAVCQKELMQNLSKMDLHLYPTDFVESSCTATMMSLVNSCAVVTTELGALREQVSSGVNGQLVIGHPANNFYQQVFAGMVIDLASDKRHLQTMQENAYNSMLEHSWKNKAAEWVTIFGET